MTVITQKLYSNLNEFRYMYFGIIFTLLFVMAYFLFINLLNYKKDNKKIKDIFINKYSGAIVALVIPILLEILLYNNRNVMFSEELYARFAYEYFFIFLIYVYNFLLKKINIVNKVLDFVIKHRYKIAIISFFILVICRANFSSINMWDYYIREDVASPMIGEPRGIRSDEWIVTTPINLSQEYDGFNQINDNYNNGNNDMNILHAPVKDASIIVRIFNWGYVLFGNEVGLSWAWCLKVVVMLMVFLEFGLIITKKDKGLSLMISIWLTFSPAVMWWSILELFAYGMAIYVIFHNYVVDTKISIKKKLLLAYGMIVAICNFAFVLYPAWQVPFAYFLFVFILYDFIKYFKNIKKTDWIIMVSTIFLAVGFIGFFIYTSWDGIYATMNTKYPGGREELGGDYKFINLTNYYTNFFTPYSTKYSNPCEIASFIYPGIAIIVIFAIYILKGIKDRTLIKGLKNKDNILLYCVMFVTAVLGLWLFVKWPKALAKISLLFTSPTNRCAVVFELGCVFITIIIACKLFNRKEKLINKKFAFIISILITVLTYMLSQKSNYASYFSAFDLVVLLSIIFFENYTLLSSNKKGFVYTIILISLFTSAFVNPITFGTDAVTDTKIAKGAREIAQNDSEAIWIGQGQLNSQYLVANGIKVLNGINSYPNYEWIEKVDPTHKYEQVWNRYAHIIISLDYTSKFELNMPDAYTVYLTYDNLKDIGIKYYYTNEKANDKMLNDFHLEQVYGDDEAIHYIYQIN